MIKPSRKEESSLVTNPKKEQISLVLAAEIIEKLEDVRFYAQKQLPRDKRSKLTKSRMYEIILQNFLLDYEKSNIESSLAKRIIDWDQE